MSSIKIQRKKWNVNGTGTAVPRKQNDSKRLASWPESSQRKSPSADQRTSLTRTSKAKTSNSITLRVLRRFSSEFIWSRMGQCWRTSATQLRKNDQLGCQKMNPVRFSRLWTPTRMGSCPKMNCRQFSAAAKVTKLKGLWQMALTS